MLIKLQRKTLLRTFLEADEKNYNAEDAKGMKKCFPKWTERNKFDEMAHNTIIKAGRGYLARIHSSRVNEQTGANLTPCNPTDVHSFYYMLLS